MQYLSLKAHSKVYQFLLEDIYYIRKYKLIADDKKLLVKGSRKEKSVLIPEDELDEWKEVEEGQE